ncbi:MAG: hypothetical protein CVU59_03725, partial [Deltaproteobacteria bacterium HGW-Deltaproteobacteria-17]
MRTTTFLTACFASLLFLGCAADLAKEEVQGGEVSVELAQGLTVLDLQPDFSFTVRFVQGQDVIFMQAIRGRETPAEYQNDPSVPKYEIDARITDKEGRMMYVRRGGDDFVDPTWEDDLVFSESLPPAAVSNRKLFEMVTAATKVLDAELARTAGVEAMASVLPEIGALRDFGRSAPQALEASDRAVAAHVNTYGLI